MRRFQFGLLLLGIGLFVLLVREVGVSTIASGLAELGWAFAAIFAIELAIDAMHTEGWRHCLAPRARVVPRPDLLLVRTAGVGINVLTPTATVGGEVVKGLLLRRWGIELADAFASVMVDKLTFALGQAGYLLIGLVAVFAAVPFTPLERGLAVLAATVWMAGVLGFFALQRRGIFGTGVGVLRSVFGGSAMVERLGGHAEVFDAHISAFLAEHRGQVVASAAWHLVGQAARTFQFFIALRALGFEPTLGACMTAASGMTFMEATLFLVPGKLGVLEGGHVLVFSALGFGATTALTISFALRLAELASSLIGLGALGWYHFRAEPTRPGGDPDSPAAIRSTE